MELATLFPHQNPPFSAFLLYHPVALYPNSHSFTLLPSHGPVRKAAGDKHWWRIQQSWLPKRSTRRHDKIAASKRRQRRHRSRSTRPAEVVVMAEDVSMVGVVRGRPRNMGRRRRRCSGRSNTRLPTSTSPNISVGSPRDPPPGTCLTASMSMQRHCFSQSLHCHSLSGRRR